VPKRLGVGVATALVTVALIAGCNDASSRPDAQPSAVTDETSSLCDAGRPLLQAHVAWDRERPYLLAVPPAGGRGRPLVVALHGSGGSPAAMEAVTRLGARGSAAGVSVVLPSAYNALWNNFSTADKPYLDAVIRAVLRRTCADPNAVVLAGFSNGGDEAQTMGCVEAKRLRAVVVVSSSTIPTFCVRGGPPVTLLRVHGLDDSTSPFTGRTGADPRDPVLPATAKWAAYDGCRPEPVQEGTSRRWLGCAAGTSVQLLALPGQGHSWPTAPDVTGLVLDLAHGRGAGSGG
jgi:polyhydroxybutyrate depolymerase